MGYFISNDIGYYEGDKISFNDIPVPQRPDYTYTFDGTNWNPSILTINAPILEQIKILEAQQTERRVRECALGIDNGWMLNLNNQISALRATLKQVPPPSN